MNLALVSPSASGKTRAVDEALRLFPDEAYHKYSAGSNHALIYSDQSFRHRTIVVGEADSIPEEGPAASAIRALAADNEMVYETVERDEATGSFRPRRINKPGPTGLITTSTKPLGPQLGTRTLEVPVPVDAAQTRRIMRAQARAANGIVRQPNTQPFHALQRWLELKGERRVYVPYAEALALLVPPTSVAMRRHFEQVLTCVQTIALLNQEQRERTADGAVIADLRDYECARRLLAPIFRSPSTSKRSLTTAVRETVEAVPEGAELSLPELQKRLGLRSKSTVSDRVKRAIRAGLLENLEHRMGVPARIVRRAPLPNCLDSALPAVEVLREKVEELCAAIASSREFEDIESDRVEPEGER